MSKLKRNVFATLLLSWASLNPAFCQDSAATPGTATLNSGGIPSTPQSEVNTTPPTYYATPPEGYTPEGYGPAPYADPQYGGSPQDYNPYNSGMVPSYANNGSYTGYVPYDPFSTRLMTRSDIGTGLGYQRGYQTFAGMLPLMLDPNYSLLFASIRGNVGYDGSYGFNAGAGARWYDPELDRVFGGSFWFDDDDRELNRYQQLGISLESLGTYVDFRVNAYMPTNQDQRTVSKSYTGEVFFLNHNVGLGQRTVLQSPMRGGDFEVGGGLPGLGDFGLRAYLGSYYFDGDGVGTGSMVGFKGRMEALVTEDIWVQLGVTDDRFFGTNTTMAVTLFLPDGTPNRILSRQPTQERLYYPVERNYRVTVHQQLLTDPELAINPRTGNPYYVDHVDNTNGAAGDGSFENPYDTLPGSAPGTTDIIYVHAGDGTSNQMDTGIALADFQRLWGDGVIHTLHAVQDDFNFLTGTAGVMPIITNTAGDAVTLANHNEVSGFRIDTPLGAGIYGSSITDFDINNVHVTNAGTHGIELLNATNSALNPDYVSGTGNISEVSVLDSTSNGANIQNNDGSSLDLEITESTFNRNIVGVEILADNASTIDVAVSLSNMNANSIGGEVSATSGATINGTFSDSTATNNTATGIEAHANNATVDLTVSNVEAALNGTNGLFLEALNAGSLTASVSDSILDGNTNHGLFGQSDASLLQITASGNTFDSNLQSGMHVEAANTSLFNAVLTSNTFDNNGARGMFVGLDTLTTGNLVVESNSFSNNTGVGVDLQADGGSVLNSLFTSNTFDSNGNVGFNLLSTDSSYTLTIGGVSATDDGNTFTNNTGAGIAIHQVDTGSGSFSIQNNLLTGTLADADTTNDLWGDAITIRLDGTNATTALTNSLIDANIIGSLTDASLGNAGRGIATYLEDYTTISNLTMSSNIIGHSGDNGIDFLRQNNGTVDNIGITDNIIQTSAVNATRQATLANDPWNNQLSGNGIQIVSAGSNVDALLNPLVDDFTINANQVTNNAENGLHLRVEADANMRADASDNTFSNNGSNGILASERFNDTSDLRSITGDWTGNTISNNEGIVGQNSTGNGIRISSVTAGLNIGLDGAGLGNTITSNGDNILSTVALAGRFDSGNGIDITSSGTLAITNNLISNNYKGIHISAYGVDDRLLVGSNSRTVDLTNNRIIDNRDDGIEMTHYDANFARLNAITNIIANNGGRGVDVLNSESSTTFLQFGDGTVNGGNIIEGNAFEGFYVVNTSAGDYLSTDTVNQDANDALAALQQDGDIHVAPDVVMDLQYNRIQGNGASSSHTGTGLVIYVGTSNSSGFNSMGTTSATPFGNGRVNARVVNNEFGGNYGSDVYVQSFTSTVDPGDTAGEWLVGAANPSLTSFEGDPLARLNMVFRGNTGDGEELTTIGGLAGTLNVPAWYDNSEGTFKSRASDLDPVGPFSPDDADRRRNAQRLPGDLDIPVVATTFLYPGMGLSTFRIETDFDTSGFTSGLGFLVDTNPVPPIGNMNGLILPNDGHNDFTTPYGWSSAAVGTFQFLIP